MNRPQLMIFLNQPGRFGTLSTTDAAGNINSAIFGSARMTDENTLTLGLGANRSLANLKEHPQGVFMFFEPGETLLTWKGARLYLEVQEISAEGPLFDEIVQHIAQTAGKMAASSIHAAVTFKITNVRPILDLSGSTAP